MFKNLSLKSQLATGFAAVVAVFLVTLLVVVGLLARRGQGVQRVDEQSLPLVLAVDQMDLGRSEVQQFLTDVSATHDPAAYKEAEASAALFQSAAKTVRQVLEHDGDNAGIQELGAIETAFAAFYASGKTMAQAYVSDGIDAGNLLMKGADGKPGFDQASEAVSERLTKFRELQLQRTQKDTADVMSAAAAIQSAMLWGGLIATLLAAAFGTLIVRVILSQLGGEPRVAVNLVQRVGAGDLSSRIDVRPGDSTSLMAHLQAMQTGLRVVVATVREKAQSVESASVEIESGNDELSSRAASQASSLQETAAAMEELNATVKQNVDGARQASAMASAASATAVQGGELVARFVDTMQGINGASHKISDIIGVIDGIAFQTNILALNAAVEAARAGEQGRGFAVVASEVRSLAGRSAEAAKAIKALISASVEQVDEGAALVSRAQAAMTEVVDGIRGVSDTVGEMTSASAEQSAGVTLVAESITAMDRVTQQNAALVEQSAAAAVTLRQQAQALAQAVAVFKLGAGHAGQDEPTAVAESSREPRALVPA